MIKVVVYEPSENDDAEDNDELVVVAMSEESFNSGEHEEYEEDVLKVMNDLGFIDVSAFSYQHHSIPYEASLEILKNDPRIIMVDEPEF